MCILRALYWCCECVAKRVFSCSDLPSQAVPCRSRCGRPVNQLCMVEAVEGEFCLPEVSEAPEATRCVLLCMLEAVEGRLCLLEVLYVLDVLGSMRRVLRCMLEVVEGELCLPEVVEASEATRCVPLCMLEAVEGRFCLLEVLYVLDVLESMHRVLLCMLEVLYVLEVLGGMHHGLLCVLEAVEGRICLLEGMSCVLLCMLEVWKCQRRYAVWYSV